MSSLARYLAPSSARPNPDYVLEWRHAEGGPWLLLANARTRSDVASELASPTVPLTRGDLARVRDPRGVVVGFLVQTDEGLVPLPSGGDRALIRAMYDMEMAAWFRACGHDWEKAWEGSVRADWLLYLAGRVGVDPRPLTLAACACAETALPHVQPGEARPRLAIEAARRWARGEATDEELEDARAAAWAAVRDSAWPHGPKAAASAAFVRDHRDAARDAASEAAVGAAMEAAMEAAREAAGEATQSPVWTTAWVNAWGPSHAAASASLAHLVRQQIPLWRLALALESAW